MAIGISRRSITIDDWNVARPPTRASVRPSTRSAPPRISQPIGVRPPSPRGLPAAAWRDPDFRGITSGSQVPRPAARSNYISMEEAVNDVTYVQGRADRSRSASRSAAYNPEIVNAAYRAGADDSFLFAGQRSNWEDEDSDLSSKTVYTKKSRSRKSNRQSEKPIPRRRTLEQGQPPVPRNCAGYHANGVNVLARTALAEAGELLNDDVTVAALMLSQLNYYRVENTWYPLGTFGDTDLEDLTALENQPRLNALAGWMLAGYCRSEEPLSMIPSRQYPDIASNIEDGPEEGFVDLEALDGDLDARYEISIHSSRVPRFMDDDIYPTKYLAGVGEERAVIVGSGGITEAWIEYQCPVGQNAIVGTALAPDQLRQRDGSLEIGTNTDCTTCNRTSRRWWWSNTGSNYILLSEADFQARVRTQGGQGYVASCTS